jgi:hypothetical protein
MIATAVLAAGSLAMGVAGGISKQKEGRRMQQEAQRQIDAFKWQELQNPYKNMQVSTLAADLQREEADVTEAGMIDSLQTAGNRAMVGSVGKVQANANTLNREIATNLDEQQKAIDRAAAQQDINNQSVIEGRQQQELAGYGQQLNVGMGMKYQGQADVVNGIASAGQAIGAYSKAGTGAAATDTSQMGGGNFQQFDFSKYTDPNYSGAMAYGVGQKVNELVGSISNSPDYAKVYGTSSFGMGQGMGFGLSY